MGGEVVDGRLQGALAVSRGFGDFIYKPVLTAVPNVQTYSLGKSDFCLVVACDGVWDVMTDIDAVVLCL